VIENPLEFKTDEPVIHCSSLKINNKPCDKISACKRKFFKNARNATMTFLPDVDVKSVGPEKYNNPEKPFSQLSN